MFAAAASSGELINRQLLNAYVAFIDEYCRPRQNWLAMANDKRTLLCDVLAFLHRKRSIDANTVLLRLLAAHGVPNDKYKVLHTRPARAL
jgi:hypothetical protein